VKIVHCQQGTPEWLQARCGVITASEYECAISVLSRSSGKRKAGDPTAASDKYAFEKAIERISRKPYGEPPKAWVLDRGHRMEEHARIAYEAKFGEMVTESGIVLTDDNVFGYSTDGLVGEHGLVEIKSPIDGLKIGEMFKTGDVSEYMHQIQGGMWLTGRKWCDLIMYVPDLETVGNDLYIKRVQRDDDFIDDMVGRLLAFDKRVQDYEILFRMKEAA
jgi:exodeoxyribonuclease (lambda-induced)